MFEFSKIKEMEKNNFIRFFNFIIFSGFFFFHGG